MRWVYAADLGGTNIRMAAVREDGTVGPLFKRATPDGVVLAELVDILVEMIAEIDEASTFPGTASGFGIGTPAPSAGPGTTTLSKLPNLPSLNGADLGVALFSRIGIDVVIENDATAAAIGEHWLGSARGVANSITVTIGTGIGGGLIINGEPFRGIDGTAGEIGHICIQPDGLICGCGSRGCVEQYASVTAIERMATEAGFGQISGDQVYEFALNGDERAVYIFNSMGRSLGIMIAGLINTLNPEIIILAGGGAKGWDMFRPAFLDEVKTRSFQTPYLRTPIAITQLSDQAGILGIAKTQFSTFSDT